MLTAMLASNHSLDTIGTSHGRLVVKIDDLVANGKTTDRTFNVFVQFNPNGPLYFYEPGSYFPNTKPLDYQLPAGARALWYAVTYR